MNIYLIDEDSGNFCVAAETMTAAIDKCREVYIAARRSNMEGVAGFTFDLSKELSFYEETVLVSCALISELASALDEAGRTLAAIDELVKEEANTVTIVSGNADFDGPDYIITCKGGWTDWTTLTIPGESRLQCLEKAVELKRKA